MANNRIPPKKQTAKNQGPKNQGPKNQGPKKETPRTQPRPATSIARTPTPTRTQASRNQPPKKQDNQRNRTQTNRTQTNRTQANRSQTRQNRNTTTANRNRTRSTTGTRSSDVLSAFQPDVRRRGRFDITTAPNQGPSIEALIAEQQQNFIREQLAKAQEVELSVAEADNATRVTLGSQNLEGVRAQAEATKFASTEQAGATKFSSQQAAEAEKFSSVQQAEAQKFSATEQARGSIETQRVASQSQERQIGLTGEEERKTNLQSELFRRFKEAKDQLDALKAFKA